ncbi:hypothetical protein [Acidithrix ferrooxidans]|uniref:Uncharacterized protein n=1 Tax=Acidithrix ferrooxidans TaxID=1280514 RepID=A0A0D8HIS5_9ACTN|nr:hypothetical protein [Acidithrix ferrooxidans]KJF16976.1 hypothetical protein AXFE_21780 [Acidithrix ferrooxidans]
MMHEYLVGEMRLYEEMPLGDRRSHQTEEDMVMSHVALKYFCQEVAL